MIQKFGVCWRPLPSSTVIEVCRKISNQTMALTKTLNRIADFWSGLWPSLIFGSYSCSKNKGFGCVWMHYGHKIFFSIYILYICKLWSYIVPQLPSAPFRRMLAPVMLLIHVPCSYPQYLRGFISSTWDTACYGEKKR